MQAPTFKQQYDKIVSAYFKDELQPYIRCACFIGNLIGDQGNFREQNPRISYFANKFYTEKQIEDLERNFLITISQNTIESQRKCLSASDTVDMINIIAGDRNYENALFMAMDSTLQMLKEIHKGWGENVEECKFEKRTLQTT